MRFQQLKRRSNVILKKKLYKSGKNWVIKSSLSFAGGLILFGATQAINVSADTVPTVQTQSVDTGAQQGAAKPVDTENSTETQNSTSEQTSTLTPDTTNIQQNTDNTDPTTVTKNSSQNNNQVVETGSNNSTPQVKVNYDIKTSTPVAQASAQSPVSNTDNNIAPQNQTQVTQETDPKTVPAGSISLGSCYYYVDDNQVLHITGGEFTQSDYDAAFKRINEKNNTNNSIFTGTDKSFNKISFDGKVIAHGDISSFFEFSQATEIDNIENLDTSDVTNFTNFLANSHIQSFDLGKLDTSKATSMKGMFQNCTSLTSLNTRNADGQIFNTSNVIDFSDMFYNTNLSSLDLIGMDTRKATNMDSMFASNSNLHYLDVSSFNTSNVTDMSNMFHAIGSSGNGFADIAGLEKFDTSNVTDMSFMFVQDDFDSSKLQKWNTSKVQDMSSMFLYSNLKGKLDLSNFVGDSLISMSSMFDGATKLTEIDLSNLNAKLKDTIDSNGFNKYGFMRAFEGCHDLVKVDLSKLNTNDVKRYSDAFQKCPNLTTIIWPEVSTEYANDFDSMFAGDSSLTSDNLAFLNKFNTSNVKIFRSMFSGCQGITTLHPVESWNVDSGSDFSYMFNNDTSLTSLDLSKWSINNAKILNNLFALDTSLSNLKLPKFDDPQDPSLSMEEIFAQCDKLHLLDFSNFNIPTTADKDGMFGGAQHLYKLVLNDKVNLNGSSLSYFDIYKGWYNVGNGTDEDPQGNLILHDGNEMMKTYSNNDGPDETWVIAERKYVDYQVKYVDYDTGKDLNPAYDLSDETREGWNVSIPTFSERGISIPGYELDTYYYGDDGTDYSDGYDLEVQIPGYGTAAAKNLVYTVRVKSKAPFIIKISDVSKPIVLNAGDPNAIKDSVGLKNLDTTKQLDPDKTALSIEMTGGEMNYTEQQFFDRLNRVLPTSIPISKNVKDLVDQFIKFSGLVSDGEVQISGTLTINVSYAPNTGNNSSSSGNSDSEPVNRIVQDIDQTSATFSDRPEVQLYDFDGNLIKNKLLGTNTDWHNDQEMTLNGQTYYRVSTDEWVKSDDVYVYVEHISKVRTYQGSEVQLKDAHVNNARKLAPATDWKTDRYAIFNGQKYYRVSTNEFIPDDKVYEYQDSDRVIHSKRATPVYDEHGNGVGSTLAPDTDYKTDKSVEIGREPYYRVSSNEFVKTNDID
ncbi:BspA family leucine-rich repeat surface protein [Companilactobacillus kedongensis]|uniref:BspA family leucine-rich repeat surface protein n=1 Tax=Companilactobacillus kedongensis TaxID=2486004 RepID=UPI0013DE56C6|nr:BspA family leucine-rich repeat surface protein [Companilactobacillus kedongensis]